MRRLPGLLLCCLCCCSIVSGFYAAPAAPAKLTAAAETFLQSLSAEQQKVALLPYDAPQRLDWHFIPKPERKGMQFKLLNESQRAAAIALLKAALSDVGYGKATKIMSYEALLHELESGKGQNIRDSERYFFTLFGAPRPDAAWGLSIEGHHLSLNFVIDHDKVVSSTPQVFASNPAVVMAENKSGIAVGSRILKEEETLAIDLLKSLNADQKKLAVLSETPLKEIRNAGVPQPPNDPAEGIAYADLAGDQRGLLLKLIQVYCSNMPEAVGKPRMDKIQFCGVNAVRFAWMGSPETGQGRYYKIQGPTFLIEFVNTQPDAAGNPANHIHCIFRDMSGDFALPIAGATGK